MNILGISAGFHDAAASVISPNGDILFAAHSERFNRIKNTADISHGLVHELKDYDIAAIAFYERPWLHNIQKMLSGQRPLGAWRVKTVLEQQLGANFVNGRQLYSFPHHLSHAAAGFQTSPFDRAAVVVIDAIGEIDTISIFRAEFDSQDQAHYTRLWRKSYPHSLGIFYSALTERVGLEPMEEEYITMGMSAYGNGRILYPSLRDRFVANIDQATFTDNLHVGMDPEWAAGHRWEDMAAAGQQLTEQLIMAVMRRAKKLTGYNNVVFTGGVALNCVANRLLGRVFKHAWIIPNPGDAGSSLGAAALVNGRRLHWRDVYLGTLIPGPYPVDAAVRQLVDSGIVGVASGRAEFGPRALGHRSLLADPRGPEIKDRVNDIKRRQRFRPFAPAILEELAHEYFVFPRGWNNSRYMQSTAQCRHRDLFPAICHVDGSSRVQTVPADGSGFRQLLEKWYEVTGCPMLLNTSLNVRGEPMVNTRQDADRFQDMYNVMVVS